MFMRLSSLLVSGAFLHLANDFYNPIPTPCMQERFNEITVESVASFIDASRLTFEGFGKSHCWFRGQSCASWGLIPSVHRAYDQVGEHNLSAHFRLSAQTRHVRTPDWSDLAGWISLMQHFGLPTRLLDWTSSPLTALFFALEAGTDDAAVWGLVPTSLNVASNSGPAEIYTLTGPEAMSLLLAGLERGPRVDRIMAVMGQDIDLRMTLQQGAFTLHGSDFPLNDRPDANMYLAKFVIPYAARARLKEELYFLGIRRSCLFPDLTNLALDLATDNDRAPRR